jgi:hypothetical protein
MIQYDPETGAPIDGRPDLLDFSLGKGLGLIAHYLMRFVMWLITPICLLLEIFFDWLGFTGTIPYIDLDAGLVGYVLGMVDAWVPLHEAIFETFKFIGVMIIWAPFRILIKFMFPGLG